MISGEFSLRRLLAACAIWIARLASRPLAPLSRRAACRFLWISLRALFAFRYFIAAWLAVELLIYRRRYFSARFSLLLFSSAMFSDEAFMLLKLCRDFPHALIYAQIDIFIISLPCLSSSSRRKVYHNSDTPDYHRIAANALLLRARQVMPMLVKIRRA